MCGVAVKAGADAATCMPHSGGVIRNPTQRAFFNSVAMAMMIFSCLQGQTLQTQGPDSEPSVLFRHSTPNPENLDQERCSS